MAREQAEKAAAGALTQALNDAKLSQKEPHMAPEVPPSRHKPPGLAAPLPRGGQPPASYTPPPGSPEAALLEGDLIIPGKHPRVERELPPQPSRPDGSFNPLRGRGLWGNAEVKDNVTPSLASLGPALLQQDNQQLKDYHARQQVQEIVDRLLAANDVVRDVAAGLAESTVIDKRQVYKDPSYWRLIGKNTGDLTDIEGIGAGIRKLLQQHGINTIEDLAATDPETLQRILSKKKWGMLHVASAQSWVEQARMLLRKGRDAFEEFQDNLDGGRMTEAAEEISARFAEEAPEWVQRVEGFGKISDAASIGGNALYALTGIRFFKAVADWGSVAGILTGAAQIAKHWNRAKAAFDGLRNVEGLLQTFRGGGTGILQGVSTLGKLSGALSIVTGAIAAWNGFQTVQEADEISEKAVGWLEVASGVTSMIGGVALFIPGAQPIAGVAFGISAVASGAATIVENWEAIQEGASNLFHRVTSWFGGDG